MAKVTSEEEPTPQEGKPVQTASISAEALDQEIHHDIDEREDLYNEAADEGYQADVMRADAEHYEQDAHEMHQEIADEEGHQRWSEAVAQKLPPSVLET